VFGGFIEALDFEAMAVEELVKSQEIYTIFFSDETAKATAQT